MPVSYIQTLDAPQYGALVPLHFDKVRYNQYLMDRGTSESINRVLGIWASRDSTMYGHSVTHLIALIDWLYWPGWNVVWWKFDSINGHIIDRAFGLKQAPGPLFGNNPKIPYPDINGIDFLTDHLSVSRDRAVYRKTIYDGYHGVFNGQESGFPQQYFPYTFWQDEDGNRMGPASHKVTWILFEAPYGLAVASTALVRTGEIGVHSTEDGSMKHRVVTSNPVKEIHPAATPGRCYVVGWNGIITVVDFVKGVVVGVLHRQPEPGVDHIRYGFDSVYQRLLVYPHFPDPAPDYQPVQGIDCYYPLPEPVRIQVPIPLVTPRQGRTVPMLTRAYGAASEAVDGREVKWSFGPNSGTPGTSVTQGGGWSTAYVNAAQAGSQSVSVQAEAHYKEDEV